MLCVYKYVDATFGGSLISLVPGVEVRSPLSLARWPLTNQLEMCLKAQSKLIRGKVVLHLCVERVGELNHSW